MRKQIIPITMKRQAAFFFGSGISYASGMPSVQKITDCALNGEWHLLSDGRFYPGPNPNPLIPDEETPVIIQFIKKLAEIASDYKSELSRPYAAAKPHYEELFSLAEQAARAEEDHVPNLATVDFLRRLRKETASLHCGFKSQSSGGDGFIGLANATCEFLHRVVDLKLHEGGEPPSGLEAISETARAVDALDIFTLNHDILVERQLSASGIDDVETGFSDRSRGEFSVYCSRWWKSTDRKRVRLFKPHGSVNWWLYDFPDDPLGGVRQYAIPDKDPFYCKNEHGLRLLPNENRAAFLTGTIVKELRYGLGFWGEQLEALRDQLAPHSHLIFCGYGFGDTGINLRLEQWVYDNQNHRMVILTEETAKSFLAGKPYWLSRHFHKGRVTLVPKYLQNCELSDLEPYFDPL